MAWGEPVLVLRWDAVGVSAVPAQCGSGGRSPGADVAGVSPASPGADGSGVSPVLAQMWRRHTSSGWDAVDVVSVQWRSGPTSAAAGSPRGFGAAGMPPGHGPTTPAPLTPLSDHGHASTPPASSCPV